MQNSDGLEQLSQQMAAYLLEIQAVQLRPKNPFTWASGWLSPIYCDNRLTLSYPHIRKFVTKGLEILAKKHFENNFDAVVGVATAGIAQGALLADALDLPFAYIRSSPKGHGMGNSIEGELKPGSKVLIIEDLISSGGSSLKAALALSQAGMQPMGVLAAFSYEFAQAQQGFDNAGIPYYFISNYSTLLQIALDNGYIESEDLDALKQWRENPAVWQP